MTVYVTVKEIVEAFKNKPTQERVEEFCTGQLTWKKHGKYWKAINKSDFFLGVLYLVNNVWHWEQGSFKIPSTQVLEISVALKRLERGLPTQEEDAHSWECPTKPFDYRYNEFYREWEKADLQPSDWDYVIPIANEEKVQTYLVWNNRDTQGQIMCYGEPQQRGSEKK